MAWSVKYRAELDSIKGNQIRVDILEDATIASITTLQIQDIKLNRPDGFPNKLTGVLQTDLTFTILVDNVNIQPSDFTTTSDTQYRVYLYVNDEINFKGFLDSSNIKFQLGDSNILVQLVARDGLHLLDKAQLKNAAGAELFGRFRITQYIAAVLLQTGFNNSATDYIPFNTWIDIYPTGFPFRGAGGDTIGANDPLHNIYVDSEAFRTGVNEYDNPFIVLNKICKSFGCNFFQAKGEWHLVYVEDWIRNLGLTGTKFSYLAGVLSYESNVFDEITIGLRRDIQHADNNAMLSYSSIKKKARIEFPYQNTPAKIQNQDFSIVDEGTKVVDNILGYQYYDLNQWTNTSTQFVPKIMQLIDSDINPLSNGERWLQFIKTATASGVTTVESNPSICAVGDIITIKGQSGYTSSASAGRAILQATVKVTDGVNTRWLGADGKWKTSFDYTIILLSKLVANPSTLEDAGFNLSNPKQWEITNIEPIPYNGTLTVIFRTGTVYSIATNTYTCFVRKLEIDYETILGYGGRRDVVGGRRRLSGGQFYEASEDKKTKDDFTQDAYLFNSTTRSLAGSILNNFDELITTWRHKGITETVPFGRLICDAFYKMNYRNFIEVETSIFGVIKNNQIINNFNTVLVDGLNNKVFMCFPATVDLRKEIADIKLVELLDETNTNDFDELATNRITRFMSDVGGKNFNEYDRYSFRKPSDYMFGYLGFYVDGLIKAIRKR